MSDELAPFRNALLCALAGAALACAPASAQSPAPAGTHPLSSAQQGDLALAEAGVAQAQRAWRDHRQGWYDARLNDHERYPLATIWDIVPLFESLDGIAIASPTAAHRQAVTSFALGAERYLNRGLRPQPGYSPYPGDREGAAETWFDDNGWWGLAFVNAWRATRNGRWLTDAQKALGYVATAGWDRAGGGLWWNTNHPYKAGAALASDTLLATLLYQASGSPYDPAQARRFLAWGNSRGLGSQGLYVDSNLDSNPVDYIEGPMIYAQATLCRLTGSSSECALAERLKATSLQRFGFLLDFGPQYDAIYLQWMLALYSLDHDPTLYRMAAQNALNALQRARNGQGLYLLSWNGARLPRNIALPGMLQTQAATSSLFAWLAVYPPPG